MFGILIIGVLAAVGMGKLLAAIVLGAIALLAIGASMSLNKNFVMGPIDAGLQMETAITKTANYNGTNKTITTSFAPGGVGQAFGAIIVPSAVDIADGNETYTFTLQETTDGGTTWQDIGPAITVDVTSAATKLKVITAPGFVSFDTVRLKLVVAGTTPSITYDAYLRPLSDL
jgi:hypothetical protein